MARTANSARKQVTAKAEPELSKKAISKLAEKVASADKDTVEKMVEKVLAEKKMAEAKKTASSVSVAGKSPAKKLPTKTIPTRSLSVSTPKVTSTPKPVKVRHISKNVLKEIKYYQSNIGFLVPRASLIRLVRGTLVKTLASLKTQTTDNLKFTSISLDVIHEALENYLVCLMELSYMAARHAKRVTLFPSDIRLISRIKNVNQIQSWPV